MDQRCFLQAGATYFLTKKQNQRQLRSNCLAMNFHDKGLFEVLEHAQLSRKSYHSNAAFRVKFNKQENPRDLSGSIIYHLNIISFP